MTPSVVASEVTDALRDFLTAGFEPSTPALAGVLKDDFLADPDEPRLGATKLRDKPVVGRAPQGDCVFRVNARKPVVGDDIRVDDDVHGLPLRLYSSTRP